MKCPLTIVFCFIELIFCFMEQNSRKHVLKSKLISFFLIESKLFSNNILKLFSLSLLF